MKTFTSQPKKLLLIACFFASMAAVRAQSFSITDGLNLVNTITETVKCDSMKDLHLYVNNLTSNPLLLSWKVKTNTLPLANSVISDSGGCWTIQLCDWNKCFVPPPVGEEQSTDTIPAMQDKNDMKLGIGPKQMKGSGQLVIEIYEKDHPSTTTQTITWNVTGCTTGATCTASIPETADNNRFTVYPNPAGDFITIELVKGYNKPIGSVQIYNLVGEMLVEFKGVKSNILKMDISKLPAGAYFIKRDDAGEVSVKRFFK